MGFNNNSLFNPNSTSGLLCRSTFCDGKFRMHVATLSVLRTASRYGFNADTGGPDEEEEDEKEDMMVVRVLFYGVGK